jgi:hypothetical protein
MMVAVVHCCFMLASILWLNILSYSAIQTRRFVHAIAMDGMLIKKVLGELILHSHIFTTGYSVVIINHQQ